MGLKILHIAAMWLFVLCLPVMMLMASVTWAVNSEWLYSYGFDKYDVAETTGLEPAELEKAAEGLISYFNSGEKTIDITVIKDGAPFCLFNEREVGHLVDVKGLFRLVYWVLLGTLVYALAFAAVSLFLWKDKILLARGLLYGGGLTLVLMAALGLGTLFGFDELFLQFHLISFANDLWMLNPATDYLIMLFPRGFWFDAALFCAITTAILALILGGVGWWLKRKGDNRE
jgi:integral membrane protein (TIGR01906 family)